MTKEELEKEAEEKAETYSEAFIEKGVAKASYAKGYLAGAEPRERQIQIDAEQIRALQKDKGELIDRVRELEAQIEKMKCCGNCGNERCTSKYRGNSAYHTQKDGFQCADNEDWKPRS